jgi:O-antigen ligase/cytochrome c-type biogenesis protein CcmH/NrfG
LRWSAVREAAAALIVGAVLVFDPFGWAAFGPLKWVVVSTLALAASATKWLRPFEHHSRSTLAWIAFLGWGAVCAATGLDPLYSWIGTPDRHLGWLAWLIFGLTFLVGQNLVEQGLLLARTATVATAGLALYCFLELADVAPIDLAVESARVGGPFGSPAYLGAACSLLLPIAGGLAADAEERKEWRLTAALALAGGLVAAVASQTRAAWIGIAVSGVVMSPLWWPRIRSRWWLVAAASIVLVTVTPVGPRIVDGFAGDAQGRIDEWRMGAAVVADNPLLGVGPEGYRIAFPSVVDADYERRYTRQAAPDRAHSGALDTAAMFGLVGLIAYLAAAGFLIRRSWQAVKSQRPLLVGFGAALIGYLVQQQFLFPIAEIDDIFWLFAGIVVASTGPMVRVAKPPVLVGIVLGSLAVVALVGGILDVFADHQLVNAQRHPDVAPTATDSATTLRPDSIRYWLAAADARAANGDLQGADGRIDRALSISPLDPILLATKGRILLAIAASTGSADDIGRAVTFYDKLLAVDPNNGQNQLRAGTGLVLAGEFEDAEKAFLAAADLAPSSSVPFSNLARLYLATGNLDNAVDSYHRALMIDPTAPGLDEIAGLLESAGANIDG